MLEQIYKIELTEFVSLIAPFDCLLVERNKKVSERVFYMLDASTPNTTKQDSLSTPLQSPLVKLHNDSCGQLGEMLSGTYRKKRKKKEKKKGGEETYLGGQHLEQSMRFPQKTVDQVLTRLHKK